MADELGGFISYVRGVEHAHVLLPPLETLCIVEETVVREKVVESLCSIGAQMKESDVVDWFIPLVKRLSAGEWFTAWVSTYGLFHIVDQDVCLCGGDIQTRCAKRSTNNLCWK